MACRVLASGGYQISYGYSGSHQAVDMTSGANGTDSIVAHSAGTVVWCQSGIPNAQGSSGNRSYGNCVQLKHAGGYSTLYAHLDYISVSTGQSVGKGQKLGYMGNTGNSYGAHLHFEVRDTASSRINPTRYVGADLPGLSGGGSSTNTSTNGTPAPSAPARVDITQVKVMSVQGQEGERAGNDFASHKMLNTGIELLIQNQDKVYMPVVLKATIEWNRKESPGTLKFDCVLDKDLHITEGNPVSFRFNGVNVFYGYIFEKSEKERFQLSITCYDQLRYMKNKTAFAHTGKKYSQLVVTLAEKYKLRCGAIEDTRFQLGKKLEDGTLFDILGNASDETVMQTGRLFVLYDDYGKICLKNIESMFVPIMVDEGSAGKYKYTTSIDKDVYTRIVLTKDDDTTGVRGLYVANNQQGQKEWGILEYYEAQNDMSTTELKESAKLLSAYFGKKRRTLSLQDCFGDIRVRGGSSLVVYLQVNDKKISNVMVAEKVKHQFEPGIHTMDLELSGVNGEFVV